MLTLTLRDSLLRGWDHGAHLRCGPFTFSLPGSSPGFRHWSTLGRPWFFCGVPLEPLWVAEPSMSFEMVYFPGGLFVLKFHCGWIDSAFLVPFWLGFLVGFRRPF